MKSIEIEDIATVFASEFVRLNRDYLRKRWYDPIPFLKMNYSRRRKLVEKVLDKMLDD